MALPPQIQVKYLTNSNLGGKRIFLEKPLAPTLSERMFILERLMAQKIDFSIGYLFMLTEWGKQLSLDHSTGEVHKLRIEWKIPRPKSSWKMSLDSGGGIINYYVIHFLKLMVDLNYDSLAMRCVFEENHCRLFSDIYDLSVNLTEDNVQNFAVSWINGGESRKFEFATPFGPQNIQGLKDARVKYLSEYLMLKPKPELEYDTETRVSKLLFQILA
jgi:predicted dehydrogenase